MLQPLHILLVCLLMSSPAPAAAAVSLPPHNAGIQPPCPACICITHASLCVHAHECIMHACAWVAHVSRFLSMPSWWMPDSWAKALAPTMACQEEAGRAEWGGRRQDEAGEGHMWAQPCARSCAKVSTAQIPL
jgi:hypothetical protein